jgi:hypothetical protein
MGELKGSDIDFSKKTLIQGFNSRKGQGSANPGLICILKVRNHREGVLVDGINVVTGFVTNIRLLKTKKG